jgi:hypothetical protein
MTAQEYAERVNTLEAGIDRLNRERLALLRDIVAVLSKVVDAMPPQD